jgi:hypothetical protein
LFALAPPFALAGTETDVVGVSNLVGVVVCELTDTEIDD